VADVAAAASAMEPCDGALDDFCTAVLAAACLASLVCWLRPCNTLALDYVDCTWVAYVLPDVTYGLPCGMYVTHLDDSAKYTNQTVSCYCLVSNLVLVAQNTGSVLHKMRHGVPCAHPTAK
jgi:hypothetical protein